MKRILVFVGGILLTSSLACGQEQKRTELSPTMPRISFAGYNTQEFGWMSDTTKGAPFTAQQSTEVTQTLADGTHITRTNTVTYFRDSQGRVRREDPNLVSIDDPVAGVTYRLEKNSHSGMKTQLVRNPIVTLDGANGTYTIQLKEQAQAALKEQQDRTDQENRLGEVGTLTPAQADQEKVAREIATQKKMAAAGGGGRGTVALGENKNETQESLGSQMMEGVAVDGTRTTVVIPTGQIGNDRPIMIVTERWYSPELHIFVMTRHSDPRSGENIVRYTGIQRAEPDSALFQAPAGYTLREEPRRVVKDLQ